MAILGVIAQVTLIAADTTTGMHADLSMAKFTDASSTAEPASTGISIAAITVVVAIMEVAASTVGEAGKNSKHVTARAGDFRPFLFLESVSDSCHLNPSRINTVRLGTRRRVLSSLP
jgi:hypothetical protein